MSVYSYSVRAAGRLAAGVAMCAATLWAQEARAVEKSFTIEFAESAEDAPGALLTPLDVVRLTGPGRQRLARCEMADKCSAAVDGIALYHHDGNGYVDGGRFILALNEGSVVRPTRVEVRASGDSGAQVTVSAPEDVTFFCQAPLGPDGMAVAEFAPGAPVPEIGVYGRGHVSVRSLTVFYDGDPALEDPAMRWDADWHTHTLGEDADPPRLLDAPGRRAVAYSTSDEGVAGVSPDGTLDIRGAGTAFVTASFGGDGATNPLAVTYTLEVLPYSPAVRTYRQVTSSSEVAAGGAYILADGKEGAVRVMGRPGAQKGAVEAMDAAASRGELADRYLSLPAFTLVKGASSGRMAAMYGEGEYLSMQSAAEKSLMMAPAVGKKTDITIDIKSGKAAVTFPESSNYKIVGKSAGFVGASSSATPNCYLYKLASTEVALPQHSTSGLGDAVRGEYSGSMSVTFAGGGAGIEITAEGGTHAVDGGTVEISGGDCEVSARLVVDGVAGPTKTLSFREFVPEAHASGSIVYRPAEGVIPGMERPLGDTAPDSGRGVLICAEVPGTYAVGGEVRPALFALSAPDGDPLGLPAAAASTRADGNVYLSRAGSPAAELELYTGSDGSGRYFWCAAPSGGGLAVLSADPSDGSLRLESPEAAEAAGRIYRCSLGDWDIPAARSASETAPVTLRFGDRYLALSDGNDDGPRRFVTSDEPDGRMRLYVGDTGETTSAPLPPGTGDIPADGPAEYYDLTGARVPDPTSAARPAAGVYIRRTPASATKILVP